MIVKRHENWTGVLPQIGMLPAILVSWISKLGDPGGGAGGAGMGT